MRRPFNRVGWAFENKLDGFRALARREGDRVNLLSRTGRSIATNFPDVVSALKGVDGDWVLDGELVVPDKRGHPTFESVRRRGVMKLPSSIAAAVRASPAALCVFDLLLQDGEDLRRLPLSERKERLAALVETKPGLQLVRSLPEHSEALFAQACEMRGRCRQGPERAVQTRCAAVVGEGKEPVLLAAGGVGLQISYRWPRIAKADPQRLAVRKR